MEFEQPSNVSLGCHLLMHPPVEDGDGGSLSSGVSSGGVDHARVGLGVRGASVGESVIVIGVDACSSFPPPSLADAHMSSLLQSGFLKNWLQQSLNTSCM